LNSES